MIYINNHPIEFPATEGKRILYVYSDGKLIWLNLILIISCFARGYWINNNPWTNNLGWKNG